MRSTGPKQGRKNKAKGTGIPAGELSGCPVFEVYLSQHSDHNRKFVESRYIFQHIHSDIY